MDTYWNYDAGTTRPFYINKLERAGYKEVTQVPPFSLPVISFMYLMEGEVLVEVNGKTYLCTAGQILLIPESIPFSIKHFKDCIGFDGGFQATYLKDASYSFLSGNVPVHQTFWFEDGAFMGVLFRRIYTASLDGDDALIRSGIDLILGQLKPPTPASVIPERFLQMVFDRNRSLMPVVQYAELLHVSPNYLNKVVKAHTFRSAIEWIEISRLNYAKQLLMDKHRSMVDIATAVGLEDQSYFSRFFKKMTGMTPTSFRNQL